MIWKIEEMHEDLKCYFGLEECYSGKEETYYAHLAICYLLFLIFWSYKIVYSDERTIEQIWWDYCMNYDKIASHNSQKHNRTEKKKYMPFHYEKGSMMEGKRYVQIRNLTL